MTHKRLGFKVLLLLFALAFTLGAGEIAVRLGRYDRVVEEVMYNTPREANYGCRVRVADQDIGWFLTGYDYSGDTLTIRFAEPRVFMKRKPHDTFRILVLGDSIAEVWTTWNPCDKFPQMLERELNAAFPARKFEVMNVSVGSYNTFQRVALLKKWFHDWDIDLLVIQHCLNDDAAPYEYIRSKGDKDIYVRYSDGVRGLRCFRGSVLRKSALFRFVDLSLYNSGWFKSGAVVYSNGHQQRDLYAWVRDYCSSRHIGLFVLVFPYLRDYNPGLYGKHDALNALLMDLGIAHYDLLRDYQHEGEKNLLNSSNDRVHPNRRGHEIAADKLKQELLRCRLLESVNP